MLLLPLILHHRLVPRKMVPQALVVQPHLLPLLVQVMGALLRAVREVLRIREGPRAVQTVEHLVVRLGARMVGHLEGQTVECRVVRSCLLYTSPSPRD